MNLIEVVIAALIAGMLSLTALAVTNLEPLEMASSISHVGMVLAEARSVARANNDEFLSAPGDGATVQFTTDPDTGETVVKVYWGRPRSIDRGKRYALTPERIPELHIKAQVHATILGVQVAPPFAIFLSPSGHASGMHGDLGRILQLGYTENLCLTEIPLEFTLRHETQHRIITCEFAGLRPVPTAESSARFSTPLAQ